MSLVRPLPYTTQMATLSRFAQLRMQIYSLAQSAAALPVPAHYQAQAEALAKIAALKLHDTHGEPGPDDALAVIDDLRTLWRAIDPMISAIGANAAAEFSVPTADFECVLENALDGDATYELGRAADRLREAQEEYDRDPKGWEKARAQGVD